MARHFGFDLRSHSLRSFNETVLEIRHLDSRSSFPLIEIRWTWNGTENAKVQIKHPSNSMTPSEFGAFRLALQHAGEIVDVFPCRPPTTGDLRSACREYNAILRADEIR